MSAFIHPQALCETASIGSQTRVWAFAHVLPGARIGRDCNICDHVFIENDVIIGDRVTVKCGVQLWDGVRIEDDVFIGPNATFTNDPFPRSRRHVPRYPVTTIASGASIGANATILPGLTIGCQAMVGAGAVVTRNVPPYAIVAGNPGRIVGYDSVQEPIAESSIREEELPTIIETRVRGVTFHRLPRFRDIRGSLCVGEFQNNLPFQPRRYFLIYDVSSKDVRGEHAHRTCHQFLICASGSLHVVADDGQQREEVVLDSPELGLYLPPLVWATQYKHSKNAALLVFASHPYDANDYIREYDEFLGSVHLSRP